MDTLILSAINAAQIASKAILSIYDSSNFCIENKSDKSPLTLADRTSHNIICEALFQTSIPLLSEEGLDIPYAERMLWKRFWLIDPLDGTKEFIKRNGEFTVNIALIEDNKPVIGVVLSPVSDTLYFAAQGLGSWKLEQCSQHEGLALGDLLAASKCLPVVPNVSRPHIIVGSRSHPSPEFVAFAEKRTKIYEQVEIRSIGSSLKMCLVAEGLADVYPRFGPTMEWDVAAGQAVAMYTGCRVMQFDSKMPLQYNTESMVNPFFIVDRE